MTEQNSDNREAAKKDLDARIYVFGDDEGDRFFLNALSEELLSQESKTESNADVSDFVQEAKKRFLLHQKKDEIKYVIVQRDEERFWDIFVSTKI